MVKGISSISGIVRTGVISALIAGSTALYATNPAKKDTQPNQTEVVSREGASALKAASLQIVQQTAVPTVHNPRIDNDLKKYAENDDDKTSFNNLLNDTYNQYGTYLASAFMQHEINFQHLYLFMSGNTELLAKNNIDPALSKKIKALGPEFFKTVTPNEQSVTKWVMEEYTPSLVSILQFDHKPDFDDVEMKLNSIVDNKLDLSTKEIVKFYRMSGDFRQNKLNNRKDDIAKSEILAYKMYLIDSIVFERATKNRGIFGKGSFELGQFSLLDYYREWMNSINPKNK